jgi:putative oxidoreductase
MLAQLLQERKDMALLIVRLALGLIFLMYGWRHVTDLAGYTEAFVKWQIPFAHGVAPLVAWLEVLGGLAVLLGIFTRYSGLLLAIVMAVATFVAKLPAGLAAGKDPLGLSRFWDIDFSLFALGVVLLLMGPGKFALEQWLFKREL